MHDVAIVKKANAVQDVGNYFVGQGLAIARIQVVSGVPMGKSYSSVGMSLGIS
jgi:hypothetical protein